MHLLLIGRKKRCLTPLTTYHSFTSIIIFSDADLKLAPFFDGYDRRRLDEHEKELNVNIIFV